MKPRRTRQLSAVEEVLRAARDHPTAFQIHQRVAETLPHVSLGTVYRNLEKLTQAGRAVVVRLEGEVTRYDGTLETHDHFVCRGCGCIVDLLDDVGPAVDTAALERAGYAVAAHSLAVFGTCPGCA
jgi:Fe2+ or Zn2+ uptake regulation protein